MHKSVMFIHGILFLGFIGSVQSGQLAELAQEEMTKSLWDTKLLNDSLRSIGNMPVKAVDELSKVLGSCLPLKGGEIREYFCERDKITLQIRYSIPPSVKIIMDALISSSELITRQYRIPFSSKEQKTYSVELFQQRNVVIDKIGGAVSQRIAANH